MQRHGGAVQSRSRQVREIAVIVVTVLLLTWVLQTFVGRQYVVPSESMEPTLHGCSGCSNDRIVIEKLSHLLGDAPRAGDVIVFVAPTDSWNENWTSPRSSNAVVGAAQNALSWFGFAPPNENDLVKRVVATAGQTVACKGADHVGVTVDGHPIREPYIQHDLPDADAESDNTCLGADFGPILVPAHSLWVMGDNRTHSADSRFHITDERQGTVPVSAVRGKVVAKIWPASRWSVVHSNNPQR